MIPRLLTIAGSDPSGGAGIQGDLKTFAALGAYGMSAVTALTAQNTLGVQGIHTVPAKFLGLQLESVLGDIRPDAVKTGMLFSANLIRTAAGALRSLAPGVPLVVDPVMVAKGGAMLLRDRAAARALVEEFFPLAWLVTPNALEAAQLAGGSPSPGRLEMERAAAGLLRLGARAVLIKGGHAATAGCDDLFADASGTVVWLRGRRQDQRHTHGTGCALSAAAAVFLARGQTPLAACRNAKRFIAGAIRNAYPVGEGVGPVNHSWRSGRG